MFNDSTAQDNTVPHAHASMQSYFADNIVKSEGSSNCTFLLGCKITGGTMVLP